MNCLNALATLSICWPSCCTSPLEANPNPHNALEDWKGRIVKLCQDGHFPQTLLSLKKKAHEIQEVPNCMNSYRLLFIEYHTRFNMPTSKLAVLATRSKETLSQVNKALWKAAGQKKGRIDSACALALLERVHESDSSRKTVLEEFGRVWKKSNGIGREKHRTDAQKETLVWLGIEAEEEESDSSTDDESEPDSDDDKKREEYFLRDFAREYRTMRSAAVPWYNRDAYQCFLTELGKQDKRLVDLLVSPDLTKWLQFWDRFPPADGAEPSSELPLTGIWSSTIPFFESRFLPSGESQWKVAFTRFDATLGDHVRKLPHPPRNDFVQLGPVKASMFGLLPERARGETPLMAHANSMFSITQWYRSDGGPLKTLLFDSDYDHEHLWDTLNLGANDLKRLDLHSRISPFKDVSWNTRGTLCRTYEVIHAPVIHTVDSVNLLFLRTRRAVPYR